MTSEEINQIEACLLKSAKRQRIIPIGEVIKTDEVFRDNYEMHDVANHIISAKLQPAFVLGKDLRNERGGMAEECPDYYYKDDDTIFAFDVKAKSSLSSFGMVNERAFDNYKLLSEHCNCSVYLCFCHVSRKKPYKFLGSIGYSNLEWPILERRRQRRNGNQTFKLEWKEGLPNV